LKFLSIDILTNSYSKMKRIILFVLLNVVVAQQPHESSVSNFSSSSSVPHPTTVALQLPTDLHTPTDDYIDIDQISDET